VIPYSFIVTPELLGLALPLAAANLIFVPYDCLELLVASMESGIFATSSTTSSSSKLIEHESSPSLEIDHEPSTKR
jgi:hypothetical protein